jgi:integrase
VATIRKRGEGVWEVRVFVGRDERGKPIQRSKTVRGGKRDAERVAAELSVKPARAGRRTVKEAIEAWIELRSGSWSPYSRRDQMGRAKAVMADRIASLPVARLEVRDIDLWIARMRKDGVGEGAIRNRVQVLRSALAQAERWGWIPDNPAAKADLSRPKRAARGVMSDDEVFAVLDAAADLHEMAPLALRLAAVTGARRSELAGLRWEAVQGDTIVFDRQVVVDRDHPDAEPGKPVLREDATKTGARRRVTVDAETTTMLAEARAGRAELAPWLFSDLDRPPNPDRIGWWWRRARDAAGVDARWRLHDLRHWSATQAIAAGYDVQTVARRLGHADATTTLRIYSHAVDRTAPALAADLGRIMRRDR